MKVVPTGALALLTLAFPLLTLASTLVGCSEDLPSPTVISKVRVLGARAEVFGDPERSSPRAGEAAQIRWDVAFPAAQEPLGWLLTACVRAPALTGQPTCLGNAIGFSLQLEPAPLEPTITLLVPPEAELGDAREIMVAGTICAGLINLDDRKTQPCARRQDEGQLVVLTLPLDRGGQANLNPAIDAIALDGSTWQGEAPLDAAATDCAGLAGIRQIDAAAGELPIELTVTSPSFESYTVVEGDPPAAVTKIEEMQVSHLTTAGYLDGLYTILDATEAAATATWTLPPAEQIDPLGTLARFHFVIRDGRGGVHWQRRSACLLP